MFNKKKKEEPKKEPKGTRIQTCCDCELYLESSVSPWDRKCFNFINKVKICEEHRIKSVEEMVSRYGKCCE